MGGNSRALGIKWSTSSVGIVVAGGALLCPPSGAAVALTSGASTEEAGVIINGLLDNDAVAPPAWSSAGADAGASVLPRPRLALPTLAFSRLLLRDEPGRGTDGDPCVLLVRERSPLASDTPRRMSDCVLAEIDSVTASTLSVNFGSGFSWMNRAAAPRHTTVSPSMRR